MITNGLNVLFMWLVIGLLKSMAKELWNHNKFVTRKKILCDMIVTPSFYFIENIKCVVELKIADYI